jgi:D-xylose 1-dehydrogenase (NADP+, D-xylono-1,5-lactone-forming)
MASKKLNWGILSTARINKSILPVLDHSLRSTCLAVASRSSEQAQQYAAEWAIKRSYGSYDELLADEDIDVIYNPLPNHLHASWTVKALEAGKHVLSEKPMALSLEEFDAIQDAVTQTGKTVTQCFMYRTQPRTYKVLELIQNGEIGNVRFIRGSFNFTLDRPDDIRWSPDFGGGSLWDIGCYPVSYARMITGCAPVEMDAYTKKTDKGIDDSMIGMMRYPNDIWAQFDCSFSQPQFDQMEVRGDKGSIQIPNPFHSTRPHQIFLLKGQNQKRFRFKPRMSALGTITDIENAILTGSTPRLGLPECRDITQTLAELARIAR